MEDRVPRVVAHDAGACRSGFVVLFSAVAIHVMWGGKMWEAGLTSDYRKVSPTFE